MNDTICALATPAGGAIGIIRVSGDKAIRITDELFKAKSKNFARVPKPKRAKKLL